MNEQGNFGWAIEQAQAGRRISREGWNGRDMWVAFMPAVVIDEGLVNGRTKQFVPTGDRNVGAYFVMWTAQGVWQPGWLASQADMLATDWGTIDE